MNVNEKQQPFTEVSSENNTRVNKKFYPWATYGILAVSIAVYFFEVWISLTQNSDWFLAWGIKDNDLILSGELWRLVTPLFINTSILQIGLNMFSLYSLGSGMERFYGRLRMILLFLLSGIAGIVVSFYMSSAHIWGSATAIFGLAAAEVVFLFRNRLFFGDRAKAGIRNMILIIGLNLFIGGMIGFDNWALIGGILGGIAFSWAAGPLFMVLKGPDDTFMVLDQSSRRMTWIVAGAEVFVLIGLAVLRILKG
jgi:rhomboid protease GluP